MVDSDAIEPHAISAVVFDLDGVLVDTEQVWDDVREQLARDRGGRWHDRAQADKMGMSSPECGLRIAPWEDTRSRSARNGRR